MDLYRFIDSKDVSEYLRSINYQFSAPEAAFIVYKCHGATLKEKFEAFSEIIKTMPDCSYTFNDDTIPSIESMHQFLLDYMKEQNEMIKLFYTQEESSFYCYGYGGNHVFKSLDACINSRKERNARSILEEIFIKKIKINDDGAKDKLPELEIVFNKKFEIMALGRDTLYYLKDKGSKTLERFNAMSFSFPTPFKCGDIVQYSGTMPYNRGITFVIHFLSDWDEEKCKAEKIDPYYLEKYKQGKNNLPGTAYGIEIFDDGTIGYGKFNNYFALEKVTEPLEYYDNFFETISQYLKGEIGIESLINNHMLLLEGKTECVNCELFKRSRRRCRR